MRASHECYVASDSATGSGDNDDFTVKHPVRSHDQTPLRSCLAISNCWIWLVPS
ncbi:hypothetical protein GALL_514390 [mine drainage metagenome]|uniref:Uncharacterized protein n=1 Tax=mine drainage metagenome TaxID=410659 RepID=A0A1J5P704_9ZZZZ